MRWKKFVPYEEKKEQKKMEIFRDYKTKTTSESQDKRNGTIQNAGQIASLI
jgi:hypothetical protein